MRILPEGWLEAVSWDQAGLDPTAETVQACPLCHKTAVRVYHVPGEGWARCGGCGAAGDAVSWLARRRDVEEITLLRRLAQDGLLPATVELPRQLEFFGGVYQRRRLLADWWAGLPPAGPRRDTPLVVDALKLLLGSSPGVVRPELALGAARLVTRGELTDLFGQKPPPSGKEFVAWPFWDLPGRLAGLEVCNGRNLARLGSDPAFALELPDDVDDLLLATPSLRRLLALLGARQHRPAAWHAVGLRRTEDLPRLRALYPRARLCLVAPELTAAVLRQAQLADALVLEDDRLDRQLRTIHRPETVIRGQSRSVPEALQEILAGLGRADAERLLADLDLPHGVTAGSVRWANLRRLEPITADAGRAVLEVEGRRLTETSERSWLCRGQLWSDVVIALDEVQAAADGSEITYRGRLLRGAVALPFHVAAAEARRCVDWVNRVLTSYGLAPWAGHRDFNFLGLQAALRRAPGVPVRRVRRRIGWDPALGVWQLPGFGITRRGQVLTGVCQAGWPAPVPATLLEPPHPDETYLNLPGWLRRPESRERLPRVVCAVLLHVVSNCLAAVRQVPPRHLLCVEETSWRFLKRLAAVLGAVDDPPGSGHQWPWLIPGAVRTDLLDRLAADGRGALGRVGPMTAAALVLAKQARWFHTQLPYDLTADEEQTLRRLLPSFLRYCLTRPGGSGTNAEGILERTLGWLYFWLRHSGAGSCQVAVARGHLVPARRQDANGVNLDTASYRALALAELAIQQGWAAPDQRQPVTVRAEALTGLLRSLLPEAVMPEAVLADQEAAGFVARSGDQIRLGFDQLEYLRRPRGRKARRCLVTDPQALILRGASHADADTEKVHRRAEGSQPVALGEGG